MATIGNNDDKEMAFVRDTFFESDGEKEVLAKLNQEGFPYQEEIDFACNNDAEKYYELACKIIQGVEFGGFPEKDMPSVERTIAYCLGKIEDLHQQTQEITEDAFIPKDEDLCQ